MRHPRRITALGMMLTLSACGQPATLGPPATGEPAQDQAARQSQGYHVQQAGRYTSWWWRSARRRRLAREIAIESAIFTMVNTERAKVGQPALTRLTTLNGVANAHSIDMAARSFFSHTNPDGKGPDARLTAAGITFSAWGENIRYVPYTTESTQEIANQFMYGADTGWMNSPPHRAAILSPTYTQIGIGVYESSATKRYYGTQVFLAP